MNTRSYEIDRTAEQANLRREQASFGVELGTVTKETMHDNVPVAMDSLFTVGTIGS